MSSTAVVWEKIVRYQKYLDKCMNVAKVNEKHVSENVSFFLLILCTLLFVETDT